MGVQIADHASYCTLQQRRIVDLFDVVAFYALENLGKQLRLLPGQLFFG